MSARIIAATAPCSWGVWFADGGPSGTPWKVFLDGAAKSGYKALELGPDGYLPRDNNVLKDELSSRDMSICAGTASIKFDQYMNSKGIQKDLEPLCSRVAALNAPYLVVLDGSDVGEYSEKKAFIDSNSWKTYFTMIKELSEWTMDRYNIETVFHPHVKSLIETEKEILNMLDFCDVKLCFDTGHHVYVNGGSKDGGSSALDFIKKYSSRMAYFHFKNVNKAVLKKVRAEKKSLDTAFQLGVMCELEKGIIDFKKLKQVLDLVKYEGVGVIETDMPKAKAEAAFETAKRNLVYLQKIKMVL